MPGTISHESPRSWLRNREAGSTPAPQFLPAVTDLQRPDVGQGGSVLLREGRRRLGLLDLVRQVRRTQHLHAEERIAARRVEARRAARVDECRVHGNAGTEGPGQREAAAGFRGFRDEHALPRPDGENHAIRHLQPPETAGRNVTTSPGLNRVSTPSRSRTLSEFTNTFKWRRSAPVSSHTLR